MMDQLMGKGKPKPSKVNPRNNNIEQHKTTLNGDSGDEGFGSITLQIRNTQARKVSDVLMSQEDTQP
jgi:hypothetical protein